MLSVSEIQKFIDNDIVSEKKKFAGVGQRYYEGEHDIRKYRLFYYNADGKLIEDKVRSNVKISHPFFTELSDQLSAYMLSFDENPMVAKDTAEGLQEHLDNYFDDEFWSEIGDVITGSYTKGFEYLFAYKNADDRLTFMCADSMGVVECREKDTSDHVVKGFQGDNLDELQQNLKTKKIVGTDSEGDVEVRTVDIPYQARKTKADEDEKNIYRFGMGFNSSQVGDGNITNIVIKSRYALLDLKANKLERRLKRLLKQLLKVILDEINQQNGTGYQISDVKFEFTRSIMMNESENIANEKTEADIQQVRINTILNMATQIGDEQTLKALCDVMDWDFDELKEQLKNADSHTAQDARTALGVILPDDPDNPDDEPVEE